MKYEAVIDTDSRSPEIQILIHAVFHPKLNLQVESSYLKEYVDDPYLYPNMETTGWLALLSGVS